MYELVMLEHNEHRSLEKNKFNALLIEPLCVGPLSISSWSDALTPILVLQYLSILCRLRTLNSVIALFGVICKINRIKLPLKCPRSILCEMNLIKQLPLCFYLVFHLSINDPENVLMKKTGGESLCILGVSLPLHVEKCSICG